MLMSKNVNNDVSKDSPIDYYSRFFEVGLLKSAKTDKVVEFLDTIFCRFGYPQALRTDNGPQFISSEFKLNLETHGSQ